MLRQPIVCVLGHVDHGKCVSPDTSIQLGDGRLLQAKELYEEYAGKGAEIQIDDGTVVELKEGPEIFSFDGKKIIKKRVSHVWRRKSPENLVRVVLASGDMLNVTPEHPFYSGNGEKHGWKEACSLKEGDFVLIAGKIDVSNSQISRLKEEITAKLSISESFVVFVDREGGSEFFEKLSSQKISLLSRDGLLTTNGYECRKEARFRATDFFRLCTHFGFSRENAYDMVSYVKNSSRKWRAGHTSNRMRLPKTEAEFCSLAYAIGCIQGDGCLYSKKAALDNNEEEIQSAYIEALDEAFGLEAKVVQNHTCKTVMSNGGLTFGKFLIEVFGLPYENKSASITIPEILMLRNDTAAAFIRGWFDTDGYVSGINNSIEITSKSPHIVRAAAASLLRFGVLGVVAEKGGYWTLRVANDPYLKRFLESISPNCKSKRERLEAAVKKASTSRVFDMVPVGGAHMKERVSVSNEDLPYASRYFSYSHLSRGTVMRMLAFNGAEKTKLELQTFTEESIRFVKVRAVSFVEPESEFVYDFSVPETKNFIAERTVLHNTSLLDRIRETSVQKKEAGAITQHIGASEVPIDAIREMCGEALQKMRIDLKIPGLLFIDTPGHEAFTNLRERGGSIADMAILVVDINQGFQPQTLESLNILKGFKTPFIVAANKIDAISGWRGQGDLCFADSWKAQNERAQARLDELLYRIVGSLSELGINSERFDRVSDFSKNVAIVPVSAKTGEGVLEILLFLSGLSQKFLEKDLEIGEGEKAEGSILEVKQERGLGTTVDAVIYKGILRKNDRVVFGTMNGASSTRVRSIIKPKSSSEITNPQDRYDYPESVSAACGIKIFAPGLDGALAGSPISVANSKEEEKAEAEKIASQIKGIVFEHEEEGIVAKAESLGSLEALLKLLEKEGIPVRKSGIGPVGKKDAIDAKAGGVQNPHFGAVLAFGVECAKDAQGDFEGENAPRLFPGEVVYSLIGDYKKWVLELKEKELQELLESQAYPAEIKVVPGCIFRKSKPAIFGIEVTLGKLIVKAELMDGKGRRLGSVKGIQKEKEAVDKLQAGEQGAISVDEMLFGKDFEEGQSFYTYISREQGEELLKKGKGVLTKAEGELLERILALTSVSYFSGVK